MAMAKKAHHRAGRQSSHRRPAQLTVAFVNPHRWGDVKAKVLIQDGTGSQLMSMQSMAISAV